MDCDETGDGVHKDQWRLALGSELVGYVWVFGWLSMTIPPYIDGLRKVGALVESTVPFSIVDWVMGNRAGTHGVHERK